MALFIRQNEDRSKLQERLNAELQERHKQAEIENNKPETVEDSAFLKDSKSSSKYGWLWVLGAVLVAAIIAYFIYQSSH